MQTIAFDRFRNLSASFADFTVGTVIVMAQMIASGQRGRSLGAAM